MDKSQSIDNTKKQNEDENSIIEEQKSNHKNSPIIEDSEKSQIKNNNISEVRLNLSNNSKNRNDENDNNKNNDNEGDNDALLLDIKDKEIIGLKNLYSNSIFKLYEGNYVELNNKDNNSIINNTNNKLKRNSNKTETPVFILQLKFLDFFSLNQKQQVISNIGLNNYNDSNKTNLAKLINQIHSNFLEYINQHKKPILMKLCLKKIGFILNELENKISFVYLKENFNHFSLEQFISDYSGNNSFMIVKCQILMNLLQAMRLMHSLGKKISLLSSGLIFYNYSAGFVFIDLSFDEYISMINKNLHIQILSNFGYLDIFALDQIDLSSSSENNNNDVKIYNKNYLKTDLLLFVCLINFLFSTKKVSKKREEIIPSSTFERIINELQKDFLSNNYKLTNFLSYLTEENIKIKELFFEHINLDLNSMTNVLDLIIDVEMLMDKEYETEFCIECTDIKLKSDNTNTAMSKSPYKGNKTPSRVNSPDKSKGILKNSARKEKKDDEEINETEREDNPSSPHKSKDISNSNINADSIKKENNPLTILVNEYLEKHKKRIKLDCFHICCKYCYYTHVCNKTISVEFNTKDNKASQEKEIKNKSDMIIKKLKDMPQIKPVNILEYFNREINPLIKSINEQHDYFIRILRMEEETVESLAEYLEFCLKQQVDYQNETLEKNVLCCKEQIVSVLNEIEKYKFNNIADNKFNIKAFEDKSRIDNGNFNNNYNNTNNKENNNNNNNLNNSNQLFNLNFNNDISDMSRVNNNNTNVSNNNINNNNNMTNNNNTISNLINDELRDKINETLKSKIDILLQEKDVCQLFSKKIDYSLEKSEELIKFIKKMKNELNSNKEMRSLLDEIENATKNYNSQFHLIIENDFKNCVESINVFDEFFTDYNDSGSNNNINKMRFYNKFTTQNFDSVYENYCCYVDYNRDNTNAVNLKIMFSVKKRSDIEKNNVNSNVKENNNGKLNPFNNNSYVNDERDNSFIEGSKREKEVSINIVNNNSNINNNNSNSVIKNNSNSLFYSSFNIPIIIDIRQISSTQMKRKVLNSIFNNKIETGNNLTSENNYNLKSDYLSKPQEAYWSPNQDSRQIYLNNKVIITGGLVQKKNEEEDINQLLNENSDKQMITTNKSYILLFNNQELEKVINKVIENSSNSNNNNNNKTNITKTLLLESISESIKIQEITPMNHQRDLHSFAKISDYEVIAISGFSTPTCETYNILENSWNNLPSLPECIYNSSCFVQNAIHCYVFFGIKGVENIENIKDRKKHLRVLNYSDTIYRLKIYNSGHNDKWEIVPYKYDASKVVFNFILPIIIPLNDGKTMLILGGKHISNEHIISNNSFNNNSNNRSNLDLDNSSEFVIDSSKKIFSFDTSSYKIRLETGLTLSNKSYFRNNLIWKNRFSGNGKNTNKDVILKDIRDNRRINNNRGDENEPRSNDKITDFTYCYDFAFISSTNEVVYICNKQ